VETHASGDIPMTYLRYHSAGNSAL